jgi:tRNA(Arg) A34 adenosine deaminase TadA
MTIERPWTSSSTVLFLYSMDSMKNEPIFTNSAVEHAEARALRYLLRSNRKRHKYGDLVVIRATKGGQLAASKPCLHCITMLHWATVKTGLTIRRVYYSTPHKNMAYALMRNLISSNNNHVSRGNRR